jgi:predicted transcriptional regulator
METILKQLHMGENEQKVYLCLVNTGACSAPQLGRELALPRQTVYSILQKLVDEGFVEQSDKKGVKHFFADPNDLLSLIEKRKKHLDASKEALKKELPKILKKTRSRSFPKVQYYEGEMGLQKLFENILATYKKGEDEEFRGYGINNMHGVLSGYIEKFIKERYEYGVRTRLFIGRGPDDFRITNSGNAYGREVKNLNIEPQKAGLYLAGKQVYLFSYEDNVGVMIENKAIVKLLKDVFDERWR